MGYANQVICTVISCYLMLLVGLLQSWPSTTINIFQSSNTTLNRPMQQTELAAFGAIASIGGLVSTPIVGYLLDYVGRKNCLLFATFTQVIGWAIITMSNQVEVILTAMFLAGLGGCGYHISTLFVCEICQESIRGAMTTMAIIFFSLEKSRSTRRAMMLTTAILTLAIFQGLIPLQVYARPLFLEAVPNVSSTVASVVLAVITIAVGLLAAYLTDKVGRRPLLIYSSISSGFCCIILGTQLHVQWAPYWVTALCIYLFTITYTIGAATVPYVLIPEMFLPEVKSFMSMFIIEWGWLCNFLILFIFNPLVNAIGLGPIFYLFSAICFFSAIFSFSFLPETKGLSFDVIQTLLVKKPGGAFRIG